MILTQFGTFVFPLYSKSDFASPGDGGGALLSLPSGTVWDAYQDENAPERATEISTSFDIVSQTATTVQTTLDQIRARVGLRRRLWALMPDGTYRFVWARLKRAQIDTYIENYYFQPVTLTFEIPQPGWNGIGHGAAWLLDSGELLDAGLYLDYSGTVTLNNSGTPRVNTFTITNGGNRTVTSAILTFRAAGNPVTDIIIKCGSCHLLFNGTIAAGKILQIDTALRSVVNDDVDDYASLSLGGDHTVSDWLQLASGANSMTVTHTCAGAATTLDVTFYDGWR